MAKETWAKTERQLTGIKYFHWDQIKDWYPGYIKYKDQQKNLKFPSKNEGKWVGTSLRPTDSQQEYEKKI